MPTKGIGLLQTAFGASPAVTVTVEQGRLAEEVSLRTPERPLRPDVAMTRETVLKGRAVVLAELAEAPEAKTDLTVEVESPLDLTINRIEVQQGVNQPLADEGAFLRNRDLLVRVFVEANVGRFNAYAWIEGIQAKLRLLGSGGTELPGSPLTLKSGGFTPSIGTPLPFKLVSDNTKMTTEQRRQGADSLNLIVPGIDAGEVTLVVELENSYSQLKAENPSLNSAKLGPIKLADTREVKILFSPARLQSSSGSSQLPNLAGILQSIAACQRSYPLSTAASPIPHRPCWSKTGRPQTPRMDRLRCRRRCAPLFTVLFSRRPDQAPAHSGHRTHQL